MKYKTDLHTHTIVSGHAYSTLIENVKEAKKNGIEVLGSTDHGPNMPGGPHLFYFGNRKAVPQIIDGVVVLFGVEANIIDINGKLDLEDEILSRLDLVIASLHDVCIKPGNAEENTKAVINAMKNPYVDILGHMGNPAFPLHYEEVVKEAKEQGKIVEINNSSFKSRKGSTENCLQIAKLCRKFRVPVSISTDSHIAFTIGIFDKAEKIIKESGIEENLIINMDKMRIINYLKNKGKIKGIVLD